MTPADLRQLQDDFLTYVRINTRSDENAPLNQVPTTPGQTRLAELLCTQLATMGLENVALNPANGFVTATIPATTTATVPAIGFIAHLDTADYNADHVQPQCHPHYDGRPIHWTNGLTLDTAQFPALRQFLGETLITTDGTTLLGADDKAGIAAAVAAARTLLAHPERPHGLIRLAFGPDEEIGRGADRFDAAGFDTAWAYTLDNGARGDIEYETFNAAQAVVDIDGVAVHPGDGYGQLINALTLAEALDASLPARQRPEYARDHDGFYLQLSLNATVAHARAVYIIRDFDRAGFAARKQRFEAAIAALNATLDRPRVTYTMQDQYYNMADIIQQDPTPVRLAEDAIRAVGLTPRTVPFRGGTDGAKITYLGIPTPNLFNGGINFHGPYECVSTEAMGQLADALVAIATLAVDKH